MSKSKYVSVSLAMVAGFALLACAVVLVQTNDVSAATKIASQAPKSNPDQKQSNQPTNAYNYVAQPGDSYTLMARKAVQTYGLTNKVSLSGAQIIFCETNLTQAAGSPELNLGQKVAVKQSDVASWIAKAQKLTKSQEAAWNYYVQFVNFNTDAIGQTSK